MKTPKRRTNQLSKRRWSKKELLKLREVGRLAAPAFAKADREDRKATCEALDILRRWEEGEKFP